MSCGRATAPPPAPSWSRTSIRGSSGSSPVRYLTNVNGTLFFGAYDGTNGNELWKSDGTAAGTVLVKDIYAGRQRLLSPAASPTSTARCSSRPTTAPTAWNCGRATAPTPAPSWSRTSCRAASSSGPELLTNVNGTLFFRRSDGINGDELWKSDGTDSRHRPGQGHLCRERMAPPRST